MTPIQIDKESLLVEVAATTPFLELERTLNREDLSLGFRPALKPSSLKKILDDRIPNLYASLYGEIDEICIALKARTKGGDVIQTKRVPRAATGPDFKKILIGSRGRFGEILEATLRVVPRPECRKELALSWKIGSKKKIFVSRFRASGIRPAWFDEKGTSVHLGLEGETAWVKAQEECLRRLCRGTGGRIERE